MQVERLQAELREAQSRAATNESLAQRARTLVSTLEGRLRELEAKVCGARCACVMSMTAISMRATFSLFTGRLSGFFVMLAHIPVFVCACAYCLLKHSGS